MQPVALTRPRARRIGDVTVCSVSRSYHTHAAELQHALGNSTAAAASLDTAAELDPNNLHACLLRADTTAVELDAVAVGAERRQRLLEAEAAYLACVARATHVMRRRHRDSRAAARAARYLKATVAALQRLGTT